MASFHILVTIKWGISQKMYRTIDLQRRALHLTTRGYFYLKTNLLKETVKMCISHVMLSTSR